MKRQQPYFLQPQVASGNSSQGPLGSEAYRSRIIRIFGIIQATPPAVTSSDGHPGYAWQQIAFSDAGIAGADAYGLASANGWSPPSTCNLTGLAYDLSNRTALPVGTMVELIGTPHLDVSGNQEWYIVNGEPPAGMPVDDLSFFLDAGAWHPLIQALGYNTIEASGVMVPYNSIRLTPKTFPSGASLSKLGAYVDTKMLGRTQQFRIVAYNDSADGTLTPTSLLFDSGLLSCATDQTFVPVNCNIVCSSNQIYWFGIIIDKGGNSPNQTPKIVSQFCYGATPGGASPTTTLQATAWTPLGIPDSVLNASPSFWLSRGAGWMCERDAAIDITTAAPATWPGSGSTNVRKLDGNDGGAVTDTRYSPVIYGYVTAVGSAGGGGGGVLTPLITVGGTPIAGGMDGNFLVQLSGKVGEYTPSVADAALGSSVSALTGTFP
jgi:hypothetical protein